MISFQDELDALVVWHVLLTAANHVVLFLRIKCHNVTFKVPIIHKIPDPLILTLFYLSVLELSQKLHELLIDAAG